MAGKCCGNTCACKVIAIPDDTGNDSIEITGTGTQQDPFKLRLRGLGGSVGPDVTVTPLFDPDFGYILYAYFGATSALDHLGDVAAGSPTNGQVLGWDTATSRWTPRAAPTAAPGAVSHGFGINGDGSVGSPLVAVPDGTRGVQVVAGGIGLTDLALNKIVQHYANAAARTASTLVPLVNSLSVLDTAPGRVDYWDGDSWEPLNMLAKVSGVQALSLSGAYDGRPIKIFVKQINGTTNASGDIDLLTDADLATAAGVLSYHFQPTGTVATGMVGRVSGTKIVGRQFALTTGAAMATAAVQGILTAYLY